MSGTKRGRVITFYSYKGGVGRSMALANVAALSAKWGKRVLVIDWDLEAPGIESFFEADTTGIRGTQLSAARVSTPGIVDLILAFEAKQPIAWRDCVIAVRPFDEMSPISLISAGRNDANYTNNVRAVDWAKLFAHFDFAYYLESLRSEWISEFDFVLIDSRTGLTDSGGVCTIHLPTSWWLCSRRIAKA